MASVFTDNTGPVTPDDKGGPFVGIGCRAWVKRTGDGAVTMQIRRGDGLGGWPDELRAKTTAMLDSVEVELTLATDDLDLADFTPLSYQLVITSDGGTTISVRDHLIVTEPHSAPGA